ncbi:hypothetical protein D6B98_04840 [Bradyrhizobium sp. LVM 105]|nr:hypothetical protein D6B98_04840 [Bradyrhizobium sp. LVM 105]
MRVRPVGAWQKIVMPGLVPGIHVLRSAWLSVDGRDKPGHDAVEAFPLKLSGHIELPRPQAGRGEGQHIT